MLPNVNEGDQLPRTAVEPAQHFTEPPPRFTEATLVKRLEELGIGRPSTYASIITVLQDRDYVQLINKRFVPEDRGRLVTVFLESFFGRYVEYTSPPNSRPARRDFQRPPRLEGRAARLLDRFKALSTISVSCASPRCSMRFDEILGPHIFAPEEGSDKDPRACPSCGDGRLCLKLGKFGAFVGCANYPDCGFTRPLAGGANGDNGADNGPRALGDDPATGLAVSLRKGPYGHYVQLGEAEKGGEKPKRSSLTKGQSPDDVDLETALALLALPRTVGAHPETGTPIIAGIGRRGPYLKHGDAFVSLPPDDGLMTVGLNRAVALLAEGPKGGGAQAPLREIGPHPTGGKPVVIKSGRYGPYLQHDGINAPLPRDADAEKITLEEAVTQLAERGKAPSGRRRATGGKKKAPARKRAKSAAPGE